MSIRALVWTLWMSSAQLWSCDLCSVYNARSAMGESGQGFSLTVSEQFVPYRTVQLDGEELPESVLDEAYVDSSITHVVPTWNASERLGVSVNVPIVSRSFRRFQLTGTGITTESGNESGLGDVSVIGRATIRRRETRRYGYSINLLAGVKFPTGDSDRLRQEVDSYAELDAIYGTGHQHAVSGVHLRDLALGSGSYDGVFGATFTARWREWFVNAQLQYYLRTSGESGYAFGDEFMISGGPGLVLLASPDVSLSLQGVVAYDDMRPDELEGRVHPNTGMTAIYLGPLVSFAWQDRLNITAGVDVPLEIENDGLQNVPDWRFHGGVSWRF